jgi:hypothetical protein
MASPASAFLATHLHRPLLHSSLNLNWAQIHHRWATERKVHRAGQWSSNQPSEQTRLVRDTPPTNQTTSRLGTNQEYHAPKSTLRSHTASIEPSEYRLHGQTRSTKKEPGTSTTSSSVTLKQEQQQGTLKKKSFRVIDPLTTDPKPAGYGSRSCSFLSRRNGNRLLPTRQEPAVRSTEPSG